MRASDLAVLGKGWGMHGGINTHFLEMLSQQKPGAAGWPQGSFPLAHRAQKGFALGAAFKSYPAPCVVNKHPFLPLPVCQYPSGTGQAVRTGLWELDTACGNVALLTDAQPGCS